MQAILRTEGDRQNVSCHRLDKSGCATNDQAAIRIQFGTDPFPEALDNIRMAASGFLFAR